MKINAEIRENINSLFNDIIDQHRSSTVRANQRKLTNLKRDNIKYPRPTKRHSKKRIECELLLDDVEELVERGEITMEPTFKHEVIAEAGKSRGNYRGSIIDQKHIRLAKYLVSDTEITIRKADKTASYVLMDTAEYLNKIDTILSDTSKFKRITKDPTESLKRKINKVISTNNAASDSVKFNKLTGVYSMGYCYGNVKTQTWKRIKTNNITNSDTNLKHCQEIVPHYYITDRIYHNEANPNLNIPEQVLRKLLVCCTKKSPFICPQGNKYYQIDGVAMGSPLGVLMANFFMGCVEEEVFKATKKPDIYCRIVDDIFIKAKTRAEVEELRVVETTIWHLALLAQRVPFTIEAGDGAAIELRELCAYTMLLP
ncbi:uncharacterized protein LOC143028910 [Oratosquilla oratoria]|uniref:uncharacterized protein LOC143028910 n=1 Tax=Oratosquilla oratoria TaxID=337810 RepID=UPI003F7632EE